MKITQVKPEWVKTEWLKNRRKRISSVRKSQTIYRKVLNLRKELVAYGRMLPQISSSAETETKFFILGHGRSGSTLLVQLLNEHPKIHSEGEILNAAQHMKSFFPSLYVQGRRAKFPKQVYGFKVKLYQLVEDQCLMNPREFVLDLYNQGWKIINLSRRNYLRSQVSHYVGRHRGFMHITTSQKASAFKESKVTIDCKDLIDGIERRDKYREKEKEILQGLNYIEVVYEDDLLLQENHQRTCNKVFDHLDIEPVSVKAKLKKTTSSKLSEVIENYEEVVESLGKTKYANLLELD